MKLVSPVPASSCPHCACPLDSAGWRDNGHSPEVGDLTICQACARVLRFGRGLRLTAMTDRDERALLARDPEIRQLARSVAVRLLAAPLFPQAQA